MSPVDRDTAATSAVKQLLTVDKAKALTLAVVIASSTLAGCTTTPHNQPCAESGASEPCVQPSGTQSGWLSRPQWPAQEGQAGETQGTHLATDSDFLANPQYSQLRAGSPNSGNSGGPVYYGGIHSYYFHASGDGSGSTSSGGSSSSGGASS